MDCPYCLAPMSFKENVFNIKTSKAYSYFDSTVDEYSCRNNHAQITMMVRRYYSIPNADKFDGLFKIESLSIQCKLSNDLHVIYRSVPNHGSTIEVFARYQWVKIIPCPLEWIGFRPDKIVELSKMFLTFQ